MSAPPTPLLGDLLTVLARAAVDRKIRGIGAPQFRFRWVKRGRRTLIVTVRIA